MSVKPDKMIDLLNIYGREITGHIKQNQFLIAKLLVDDMIRYFDDYPDIIGRAFILLQSLEMEATEEAYDTVIWIQRRTQSEDLVEKDEDCEDCD